MTLKQDFHGDTGVVLNGDVENLTVGGGGIEPPKDPRKSRICPQCHQHTWRLTPYCVRCHFDLRAYDEEQRLIQQRSAARAAKQARVKTAVFFLLAGIGMIFAGNQLQDVLNLSWLLSAFGLIMALAAVRHGSD